MNKISFEQFVETYERTGRIPNGFPGRKRPYSERELKKKYNQFCAAFEPKERTVAQIETDQRWMETKEESARIYGTKCLLLLRLSSVEVSELKMKSSGFHQTIDPAHVFGKGAFKHMKYLPENVVPLNRYSHSMLDQQKHPIYGTSLSIEEKEEWWEFIVGKETYESLKQIAQNT